MQILLFGIALPSFVGAAFGIWFMRRKQAGRLDCFVGLALATTLFLSAMSEDSLIQFMALNRWLWFPISMLLGAVVVGAGLLFAQSPLARTLVVLASTISAAILLNIPSWEIFTNQLFLGCGNIRHIFGAGCQKTSEHFYIYSFESVIDWAIRARHAFRLRKVGHTHWSRLVLSWHYCTGSYCNSIEVTRSRCGFEWCGCDRKHCRLWCRNWIWL